MQLRRKLLYLQREYQRTAQRLQVRVPLHQHLHLGSSLLLTGSSDSGPSVPKRARGVRGAAPHRSTIRRPRGTERSGPGLPMTHLCPAQPPLTPLVFSISTKDTLEVSAIKHKAAGSGSTQSHWQRDRNDLSSNTFTSKCKQCMYRPWNNH